MFFSSDNLFIDQSHYYDIATARLVPMPVFTTTVVRVVHVGLQFALTYLAALRHALSMHAFPRCELPRAG